MSQTVGVAFGEAAVERRSDITKQSRKVKLEKETLFCRRSLEMPPRPIRVRRASTPPAEDTVENAEVIDSAPLPIIQRKRRRAGIDLNSKEAIEQRQKDQERQRHKETDVFRLKQGGGLRTLQGIKEDR